MNPSGFDVWVVDESVRVDPVDSKAVDDRPALFADAPENYRDRNFVWDGASRTIRLRAARNEVIGFQVIVERKGTGKLSRVRLELGDLVGPGGSRIPSSKLDLFKEWYVHVEKASRQTYTLGTGWYPDALLPCERWSGNLYPHTYVHPFEIPDLMNNIGPKQTSQALWVDVNVPRTRAEAPPGRYTGTVQVQSSAGSMELKLELDVWDFALPDVSHVVGNFHTDTEINALPEEMELKYYQMIRRHRLAMGVLGYAPGLKVKGTELEFDWSKYDARLGKYLDGSAFTARYGYSGPGEGVPIELLVLPFDAYPVNLYKLAHGISIGKEFKYYAPWPAAVPEGGPTPEYREVWKKAFQAFEQHLNANPAWNRTKPIVYLLSLDEAYDDVARERMLYYGALLREANAPRLKYRVDGWYPKETMDRLAKVLDISILGLGGFEPSMVRELKQKGVDPWFYTLTGFTDGDSLQCRAMGWIAWKYRAGSWTLWELDFNSLRAWLYPETYPDQNGHGMFIYRGETMGLDEPVASIRLKQLRRGSQDYEYFWLLAQSKDGAGEVDRLVNSVVNDFLARAGGERFSMGAPAMWKHDPAAWEKVRVELGARIEKEYR